MKVKLLLHTSAIFICSTTLALADEIGGEMIKAQ